MFSLWCCFPRRLQTAYVMPEPDSLSRGGSSSGEQPTSPRRPTPDSLVTTGVVARQSVDMLETKRSVSPKAMSFSAKQCPSLANSVDSVSADGVSPAKVARVAESSQIALPRRNPVTTGSSTKLGYLLPTAATIKSHFLVAAPGGDGLKPHFEMAFHFPRVTACTALILCSSSGWVYAAHVPPGSFRTRQEFGLVAHLDLNRFIEGIRDNPNDSGSIDTAFYIGNRCQNEPEISTRLIYVLGERARNTKVKTVPLQSHLKINEATTWVTSEITIGAGGQWQLGKQSIVYQADILAVVKPKQHGFELDVVAQGYDCSGCSTEVHLSC